MPACAPARLLPPVCLARCASVRLRPRPACHRRASVRLSPARSSVSGSARGFSSGTGAGRPSPPGSFASPAPRHLRRRPRPPACLAACPRARPAPAPSRFQFFFLRGDQRETGADARLRPGPPAPSRLSRPLRVRPPAPGPPATGARPSACHRCALLYPAAPAAFHPAQEPGGLLRPASFVSRLRPARLLPPVCLARCASVRLRPARLLPPVFSPFFLKGTRADMPAAPFFPRGFSKGKGEKTEQSGRRSRAAGQGGFFRRATGKGKRSGVSAR